MYVYILMCYGCLHEQGEVRIAIQIQGSVQKNRFERRGWFQLKQNDDHMLFESDETDLSAIQVYSVVFITPGSLCISIESSACLSPSPSHY